MSEVVQYDQLVAFLKNASLYEIYRVSAAIRNELENPARINAVREKFKVGDIISYFDDKTNTVIKACVLAKKLKYVSVQNCGDKQHWKIPYHMLKIDSREFNFNEPGKKLNKNSVKVGELVGFNNDGREVVGRVERLNQKTVSLITVDNSRWRVAYQFLYAVIDGKEFQPDAIEHQSS